MQVLDRSQHQMFSFVVENSIYLKVMAFPTFFGTPHKLSYHTYCDSIMYRFPHPKIVFLGRLL